MKILSFRKNIFTTLLSFIPLCYLSAQEQNTTISQNPKFEQLLNEKRKTNITLALTDCYKIQIYNGNSETAKKTLTDFKLEFKNIDGTIVFNTPNYKVWIGNFRTRMEAERNLAEIKKRYKNVFLIKPTK